MNYERWPTEPFAAIEADYLTPAEVRRREETFNSGPHTMHHAADCGLLALAVPTRFGGLYVSRLTQFGILSSRIYDRSEDFNRLVGNIRSHFDACSEILGRGSPAQYDLFLPQLAAGKRIAINVVGSRAMRAQSEGDTYILTGSGVWLPPLEPNHLLVMRVRMNREQQLFVLPPSAISGVRQSGRGHTYFWIDRYVTSKETLLNGNFRQTPNTEKWEAIRWRTDQSVS